MEAVRASGLVKRYGDTAAVDGLERGACAGEVRGLLGPTGAGKTTLLRILFGLIAPDAGAVALLGRELSGLQAGGRVEAGALTPRAPRACVLWRAEGGD